MSVAPPGLARFLGMIQGLRARFASRLPLATFWPRLRRSSLCGGADIWRPARKTTFEPSRTDDFLGKAGLRVFAILALKRNSRYWLLFGIVAGLGQTHFLWGPRGYSGNCLIVIDDDREDLEQLFEHIELVGTSDHPYALEREIPVWLCKGSKFGTLEQLWPKLKTWR